MCCAVQVGESRPGAVGAPVPFFVRRPDATDVSERLGRFPIDGLVALFLLDERTYPKGKPGGGQKLEIVQDAKQAANTSVGQVPDPPAKAGKATANKSKGSSKSESEQARSEDGGMDARRQAIKSEVQTNRCLVIGAGENFSLATPPLFRDPGTTEAEAGAGERKPSVLGAEAGAGDCCAAGELDEENESETVCAPGLVQADGGFVDESAMMVGRSSPFAVCLDFRIDVVEALLNAEDGQRTAVGESGDVTDTEGTRSAIDTVAVRILACGNDVEVFAVVRLWVPTDAAAVRDDEEPAIEGTVASGGASGAAPLSTGARSKVGAPTAPLSSPEGDGDATAPPPPTWYLHALSVRSGSYTGTVRCMDPADSTSQRQVTAAPPPPITCAVYDLAEWHALALVSTEDGGDARVSLCIDGDVVALQQDEGGVATAGTDPGETELLESGAVVVGGTGGKWTALAVKNLAVYKEGLGREQLRPTTRVYRTWREEQQEAKAADALEEERWVEEARKAEEEGREPGERLTDVDVFSVDAESETLLRKQKYSRSHRTF